MFTLKYPKQLYYGREIVKRVFVIFFIYIKITSVSYKREWNGRVSAAESPGDANLRYHNEIRQACCVTVYTFWQARAWRRNWFENNVQYAAMYIQKHAVLLKNILFGK